MQTASDEPPIDFPIAKLVQYKELKEKLRKGLLDDGHFETHKRGEKKKKKYSMVIKHIA